MGNRDSNYKLSNTVEIDDTFFVAVDLNIDKEINKRGRGPQGQAKVLEMVESEIVSNS
ncbi:MAG: hypothetical protein IPG55_00640 [Saprospiraceae bacterium]|nr:hypothetical protein [Candidatus Defluviibacterium haderslevense]MBK7243800.1 hypothetical protein [Candidatus Defluviibacterium haderslevense]